VIKERNRAARGFAMKYLNRYNALFETVFRASETVVEDVLALLFEMNGGFESAASTKNQNLVCL
jgi:hypothetical protein